MKVTRISPTKIEVESDKAIYTLGDEGVIAVAEQPISSFQIYFKAPKKGK